MGLVRKLAIVAATVWRALRPQSAFEYGVGDFQINPYYARIINLIGINITLAVSLNLINGLAGQFSIGHAGFMAVGGYTATYFTVLSRGGPGRARRRHADERRRTVVVMAAEPDGGRAAAAIAGFAVGIPSLGSRAITSRLSRWASARSSASSF